MWYICLCNGDWQCCAKYSSSPKLSIVGLNVSFEWRPLENAADDTISPAKQFVPALSKTVAMSAESVPLLLATTCLFSL